MTEQLLHNVHRISVPLPHSPLRAVNDYVIIDPKRSLLIDTAFNCEESRTALVSALTELGVDIQSMDIYLTHAHVDHCGLAASILGEGCTLYLGAGDVPLLSSYQTPDKWEWIRLTSLYAGMPAELRITPPEHIAYRMRPARAVPVTEVTEGQLLSYGGINLRVVGLFGHTPGHTGLLLEDSGVLFSGDHILSDISPHITAWDFDTDYVELYSRSLQRLINMRVARCLTGHRVPIEDPATRATELLTHHLLRTDEMYSIVEQAGEPVNAWYVAQRASWHGGRRAEELPPQQRWFAATETLAHLLHLCCEGRLSRDTRGEHFVFFAS